MKRIVTIKVVFECSSLEEYGKHLVPLLKDISSGKMQRDMSQKGIKIKATYEIKNDKGESIEQGADAPERVGTESTEQYGS